MHQPDTRPRRSRRSRYRDYRVYPSAPKPSADTAKEPVVIVGAGPIGLALALCLARHGQAKASPQGWVTPGLVPLEGGGSNAVRRRSHQGHALDLGDQCVAGLQRQRVGALAGDTGQQPGRGCVSVG